jgi:hypothetical protein
VSSVNDNPVANDDAVLVDEDGSVTVNVLANDTSLPDVGETLTITGTGTASHGNVSFHGHPGYLHAASELFRNRLVRLHHQPIGHGGTATATVNVTVRSVNDNPVATDDAALVDEDGSVTVNVLANDTSLPDVGETLTTTGTGTASHGNVSFTATQVTYSAAFRTISAPTRSLTPSAMATEGRQRRPSTSP